MGQKKESGKEGRKHVGVGGERGASFTYHKSEISETALGCLEATWLHTELPNDIPPLAHTKQSPLCAHTHSASLATIHHKTDERKRKTCASGELFSAQ